MKSILHDGDKLHVTEMSVSVCVKDVKDRVHQVGTQVRSRAHKHRPLEVLCKCTSETLPVVGRIPVLRIVTSGWLN